MGRKYGYPECCIQHFCIAFDTIYELKYNSIFIENGSGYVPCPDCAKKPWMEQIALINSKRDKNEAPFML